MDIQKLNQYKNTPGLILKNLPKEDQIELAAIALDEFAEMFHKGGTPFSLGAKSTIEHGIRLLRRLSVSDKQFEKQFNQIFLGTVMLAKEYQYGWIHSHKAKKRLVPYFYDNFLSHKTIEAVSAIVAETFPIIPDKHDFEIAIKNIGDRILNQKTIHIDESAYLTGGDHQQITALSVLLKQILQHNVDIHDYQHGITAKVEAKEKEAYLAQAIELHFSKQLYKATEQNNTPLIREIIDNGCFFNWHAYKFSRDSTLGSAISNAQVDAFKALLSQPNLAEKDAALAICRVMAHYKEGENDKSVKKLGNYKEMMDFFLTTDHINAQTKPQKNTALHLALVHKFYGYADKLICAGADLHIANSDKDTPLKLMSADFVNLPQTLKEIVTQNKSTKHAKKHDTEKPSGISIFKPVDKPNTTTEDKPEVQTTLALTN